MDAALTLVDCKVSDIKRSLDAQWSKIKEGFDGVARRAGWSNYLLVLDHSVDPVGVLSALAHCQPSRFIVARIGLGKTLSARVGAIPLQLGKKELLACEVLEIGLPSLAAFPEGFSLLRQWLLPGVNSHTYIDARLPLEVTEALLEVSDSVVFDSKRFSSLEELQPLVFSRAGAEDLSWVCLSPIRDQVRQIFELPMMGHLRASLHGVRLHFAKAGEAHSNRGALLCGWVAARLGFQQAEAGKGFLEGHSSLLGRVVRIEVAEGSARGDLSRDPVSLTMEFLFEAPYQKEAVSIEFSEDHIEASVDVDGCFHLHRPRENFDLEQEFRNLYLIGESFANYPAAFTWGLRFQKVKL